MKYNQYRSPQEQLKNLCSRIKITAACVCYKSPTLLQFVVDWHGFDGLETVGGQEIRLKVVFVGPCDPFTLVPSPTGDVVHWHGPGRVTRPLYSVVASGGRQNAWLSKLHLWLHALYYRWHCWSSEAILDLCTVAPPTPEMGCARKFQWVLEDVDKIVIPNFQAHISITV